MKLKPDSPAPETQNVAEPNSISAVPADSSGLTQRELLGTLGLGLALAGGAAGIAFFTGSREKAASAPRPPDRPRQLVGFNLTDHCGRSVTPVLLRGAT